MHCSGRKDVMKKENIIQADAGIRPYDFFAKVMGGKWKPYLIRGIAHRGYIRFNESMRILGVSAKVLKQQLRELEEDGIIERKVYSVVPTRVDYVLTETGKTLIPIYDLIFNWSLKRMEALNLPVSPFSYTFHGGDTQEDLKYLEKVYSDEDLAE